MTALQEDRYAAVKRRVMDGLGPLPAGAAVRAMRLLARRVAWCLGLPLYFVAVVALVPIGTLMTIYEWVADDEWDWSYVTDGLEWRWPR